MAPVRTDEIDRLLFELTEPIGREDPYLRYEAIRRLAPVALAEDGAVVLTRYADCHAVLHDKGMGKPDNDEFSTRWVCRTGGTCPRCTRSTAACCSRIRRGTPGCAGS